MARVEDNGQADLGINQRTDIELYCKINNFL